jgi:hypothetical protein
MITCNTIGKNGRMGNQMFQYASLAGIAKKNNFDYGVPFSNKGTTEHDHFCLPDCFKNLKAKDSSSYNGHRLLDTNWVFNPGFFNIGDGTDLCGYFQTEKYFKDYKKEIKDEFTFKDDIIESAEKLFDMSKEKTISLHIRLGDYVGLQNHHPICTVEYYKQALLLLPDDLQVLIFSDDIEMAKNILNKEFSNKNFYYLDTKNKFVDLYLMTKCSYHILANSTFSWWGSWLADSYETIAPEKWFGIASHIQGKHHDIYCEDWIII